MGRGLVCKESIRVRITYCSGKSRRIRSLNSVEKRCRDTNQKDDSIKGRGWIGYKSSVLIKVCHTSMVKGLSYR